MKCPVCQKDMVEQDFGGFKVDVCKQGCKGIWFDWNELSELDEKNEGLGEALREALNYARINDDNRSQINCPKCGILMQIHKYLAAKQVNVDECYSCGGFFIDSGELKYPREAPNKGIPMSAEQKLAISKTKQQHLQHLRDLGLSLPNTGRKASAETKRKISEARRKSKILST